jgi:hypothetical protein
MIAVCNACDPCDVWMSLLSMLASSSREMALLRFYNEVLLVRLANFLTSA